MMAPRPRLTGMSASDASDEHEKKVFKLYMSRQSGRSLAVCEFDVAYWPMTALLVADQLVPPPRAHTSSKKASISHDCHRDEEATASGMGGSKLSMCKLQRLAPSGGAGRAAAEGLL